MTKTRHIVAAGITLALSAAFWNSASASSHSESTRLHPDNPGIDMIVTGTNKESGTVVPSKNDRNDCGLCFHRKQLNKSTNRDSRQVEQPFPGD